MRSVIDPPIHESPRWWWSIPVILVLCTVVFWPGFSADWGRDDYMQLAMVRLIDSPWHFFTTDHFPLPNSVFRPMGFASFWLGQTLVGSDYQGHAAISLTLYVSIALMFHALLLRFAIRPPAALAATLVFALHPVTLGTALWWSARFDILAVLFVLIALHQSRMTVLADRSRSRNRHLVLAVLALMAATLSKEIGLIGAAAAFLLFQHQAWTQRESFWPAQRVGLLCVAVVLGFMAWRTSVLGTGGSEIVGRDGLLGPLIEGLLRWFELAPAYFGFQAQLGWPSALLGALLALFAVALLPLNSTRGTGKRKGESHLPLLLAALCLALLPALLQAPIVRLNALPLTAETSSVEAAMQSRLYFMSLGGLSMLLALLLNRILCSAHRIRHLALLLVSSTLVVMIAVGSHQQARSFAELSDRNAELAGKALEIARTTDWPETSPCHLVIDGINPPPEWSIYVTMDSVLKALYPDLKAIDHCFIHANYPTFYHLLNSDHAEAEAAPFEARIQEGVPLARRRIGGLTFVYLQRFDSLSSDQRAMLPRRSIDSASQRQENNDHLRHP
jgi:hypothetical protein